MEKQTSHCKLSVVKAMNKAGNVRSTRSVRMGGEAIGFNFDVILALTPTDFYQSMAAHKGHRVWQDVYRPTTSSGEV